MNTLTLERIAPMMPTESEMNLARETSQQLATFLGNGAEYRMQMLGNGHANEVVKLPAKAMRLLVSLLTEMAQGNAVSLVPIHAELSTQQAADLLNVSESYLCGLLEERAIPSHKVGAHPRIKFEDLLAYKHNTDAKRYEALSELVAQAQELNMGY